jgi:hypothetical protein
LPANRRQERLQPAPNQDLVRLGVVLLAMVASMLAVQPAGADSVIPGTGFLLNASVAVGGTFYTADDREFIVVAYESNDGDHLVVAEVAAPGQLTVIDDVVLPSGGFSRSRPEPGWSRLNLTASLPTFGPLFLSVLSQDDSAGGQGCGTVFLFHSSEQTAWYGWWSGSIAGSPVVASGCWAWGLSVSGHYTVLPVSIGAH